MSDGRRLVEALNGLLREPRVVLEDLSGSRFAAGNIRPRHYELWLAPGEIILRPARVQ